MLSLCELWDEDNNILRHSKDSDGIASAIDHTSTDVFVFIEVHMRNGLTEQASSVAALSRCTAFFAL